MRQDMASRLFALDGAEVAEVDEEPGGGRTVWLVTADPDARVCPVLRDGVGACQGAGGDAAGRYRLWPGPGQRGVGEAAVGVPGRVLPARHVHRVAAGHPAAVPGDGAAA